MHKNGINNTYTHNKQTHFLTFMSFLFLYVYFIGTLGQRQFVIITVSVFGISAETVSVPFLQVYPTFLTEVSLYLSKMEWPCYRREQILSLEFYFENNVTVLLKKNVKYESGNHMNYLFIFIKGTPCFDFTYDK